MSNSVLYTYSMPALLHGFLIGFAILTAYGWLHVPAVEPYSLQVFMVSIFGYLVIKRLGKAKVWHIAPQVLSLEMPLVSFAVLLLIGSTGNLQSLFYPITYIHLFFLVLSTETSVAVTMSLAIALFHYAMTPTPTPLTFSTLATIPVVLVFFLFAKYQYLETAQAEQLQKSKTSELKSVLQQDKTLFNFLSGYVTPKLESLQTLAEWPLENRQGIQGQIALLLQEIKKVTQSAQNQPKV